MKFKAMVAFAALIICCLLWAFQHKGAKPGNDNQQKKIPVFKLSAPWDKMLIPQNTKAS